jgi:hypothetical protein
LSALAKAFFFVASERCFVAVWYFFVAALRVSTVFCVSIRRFAAFDAGFLVLRELK